MTFLSNRFKYTFPLYSYDENTALTVDCGLGQLYYPSPGDTQRCVVFGRLHGARKVEYAYHFRKCADAVYQKLSKLVHACRNGSLAKLARFFRYRHINSYARTRVAIQSAKTICIMTKIEPSTARTMMSLVCASSRPQSAAIWGMMACQIHTNTSIVIDIIMYTSYNSGERTQPTFNTQQSYHVYRQWINQVSMFTVSSSSSSSSVSASCTVGPIVH